MHIFGTPQRAYLLRDCKNENVSREAYGAPRIPRPLTHITPLFAPCKLFLYFSLSPVSSLGTIRYIEVHNDYI